MKNRMFLAVALSLAVLFLWQAFVSKVYHIDNKRVAVNYPLEANSFGHRKPNYGLEAKNPAQDLAPSPLAPASSPEERPPVTLDKFETDKLSIEFINPGAKIYRVYLKDYKLNSQITNAVYSKLFQNETYALQKHKDGIDLSVQNEIGHYFGQKFIFRNNSYFIELESFYENKSPANWTLTDELILATGYKNVHPEEANLYEAVFLDANKQGSIRKGLFAVKDKFLYPGSWSGVAFRDRYSCLIINPRDSSKLTPFTAYHHPSGEVGLNIANVEIPPGGSLIIKSILYCGPQDVKLLKENGLGFEEVVHYGTFDFISTALLSVMNIFHKLTKSWGWALILLSIFTYLIVYPLTLKQMRSMKEMQELQPKVEALRKNYKDNPQRQNKEIMELYRQHKVNPMGGCLPMILQIPVFFGLYQALSRSIVLKGSGFFWIKDLAEPDKLFLLPQALPFIGKEINILPILMAIAMFFQQKMSMKSAAANPQMAEQQKMMVIIFPIMFGFIFYHFPSGLAVYWFLNTLMGIFAQWKTLKTRPRTS